MSKISHVLVVQLETFSHKFTKLEASIDTSMARHKGLEGLKVFDRTYEGISIILVGKAG